MNQAGRRSAILIGSSQFDKEPLKAKPLKCPERDVDGMRELLAEAELGAYGEVHVFKNSHHQAALDQIEEVLTSAHREDQVLIYYSGHGETDLPGRLYLAAKNTDTKKLVSTSIPVETLRTMIENSDCRKIILILDCCFGGAAGKSFVKGRVDEKLKELARGYGIYILTASTAAQTAQEREGDDYGLLTKHIIAGIKEGAAANDEGLISMDSLYRYVHRQVTAEGYQEPMRWALNVKGEDLVIAHAVPISSANSLQILGKLKNEYFTNELEYDTNELPYQSSIAEIVEPKQAARPKIEAVNALTPKLHEGRTVNDVFNAFVDSLNGIKLEMVYVPGGKFMMGGEKYDDEKPLHEVTVPAFYIGKFQITQAQWKAVMGDKVKPHFKGDHLPMECVSWEDAKEFCKKLSHRRSDKAYYLPTEAEWEYACRAGTTGDYAGELDEMSNQSSSKTYSVGQYKPNAFGLYDMHGNVWEWCEDVWHDNYQDAPKDGSAWLSGGDPTRRVVRGGSWFNYQDDCRSAFRNWNDPGYRYILTGFRVVVSART